MKQQSALDMAILRDENLNLKLEVGTKGFECYCLMSVCCCDRCLGALLHQVQNLQAALKKADSKAKKAARLLKEREER